MFALCWLIYLILCSYLCSHSFLHFRHHSADDEFSSSMETNVVLRNDGQVMWDQPAITKSSCSVDVAFFPFDVQECHLTFGSWTHNGNQMDLINALDSADLADFVPNVEWEVNIYLKRVHEKTPFLDIILLQNVILFLTRFWECQPRRMLSCMAAVQIRTQTSHSPST